MQKPIIVGNWKMNTTMADAMVLTESVKHGLEKVDGVDVVLCPPFVWLYPVKEELKRGGPGHIKLGAQNVFTEEEGAFTGEVSIKMLKTLVDYVIVGHSERRYKIGEDDSTINKKLKLVLAHGLRPILCIGERKREDKNVVDQLKSGLSGVNIQDISKVIVAYEPVWAVGTGEPASGDYANAQIISFRHSLALWYGQAVAEQVRIIYGGSTDSANAGDFLKESEIDGLLPGGSSLKASEFIVMCKIAAEYGGKK